MKIKCPNCGFEDEGNFCSHCGTVLPVLPLPVMPVTQVVIKLIDTILTVCRRSTLVQATSAVNIIEIDGVL